LRRKSISLVTLKEIREYVSTSRSISVAGIRTIVVFSDVFACSSRMPGSTITSSPGSTNVKMLCFPSGVKLDILTRPAQPA